MKGTTNATERLTPVHIDAWGAGGTNINITQASITKYGKLINLGIEFYTTATIVAGSNILIANSAYKPFIREWCDIINISDGIAHSASLLSTGEVQATSNLVPSKYHMIRLSYLLPEGGGVS